VNGRQAGTRQAPRERRSRTNPRFVVVADDQQPAQGQGDGAQPQPRPAASRRPSPGTTPRDAA
jgi:hypothetical protein